MVFPRLVILPCGAWGSCWLVESLSEQQILQLHMWQCAYNSMTNVEQFKCLLKNVSFTNSKHTVGHIHVNPNKPQSCSSNGLDVWVGTMSASEYFLTRCTKFSWFNWWRLWIHVRCWGREVGNEFTTSVSSSGKRNKRNSSKSIRSSWFPSIW